MLLQPLNAIARMVDRQMTLAATIEQVLGTATVRPSRGQGAAVRLVIIGLDQA